VAELVGYLDQRIFAQGDLLREHAIDAAAERTSYLGLRRPTVNPVWEEGRHHPVAWFDPADLSAHCNDFTRSIRAGDDRGTHTCWVATICDHQVAVVQRYGMYLYAHFVRCKTMLKNVFQMQPVDVLARQNAIGLHEYS